MHSLLPAGQIYRRSEQFVPITNLRVHIDDCMVRHRVCRALRWPGWQILNEWHNCSGPWFWRDPGRCAAPTGAAAAANAAAAAKVTSASLLEGQPIGPTAQDRGLRGFGDLCCAHPSGVRELMPKAWVQCVEPAFNTCRA